MSSHLLLCSNPIYGHVAPMIAIGRALAGRGDSVTLLTGRKYREAVESAGIEFRALPADVDYDDADLDTWLPGRDKHSGLAAVRHDLIGMFARPIPGQYRGVQAALAERRYDAVVAEGAFMGVLPLLLTVPASRIPVVGVSALPVTLTSVDTAPFGPALQPGRGPLARVRNRVLNAAVHSGPLKPIQTAVEAALAEVGAPKPRGNFFDQPTNFDWTFQLSASRLEYPRRELPDTVQFVGPLRPERRGGANLPAWWGDLDGRRVVHVTQGTIDNVDLGRLVVPTLRGLAAEDVLVVASTGGRPVAEVEAAFDGRLPANARVAAFLPYDLLLPKTNAVVTNGGYGGVQLALAQGIPLVVAGSTEDKPEVAARVAWSGAGVNLRTGTPTAEKLRAGVRKVLTDARYRSGARRIADELAALPDPVDAIAARLDVLVARAAAERGA